MKAALVLAAGLLLLPGSFETARAGDSNSPDVTYDKLLADDDALMQDLEQLPGRRPWLTRSMLRARARRVEAEYRQFLSDHPKHVRAMVAYGGFLCDGVDA